MNADNACGKQRHTTRKAASAHRRWQSNAGTRREKMEVYWCVCGFFHVGHTRKKKRRVA